MAGYIGSKSSVTLVDGYTEAEADAEFVAITGDTMTGALVANAGVTVDTMTLDAATLTATGDLNFNVAGNMILDADGGNIFFNDDNTTFGKIQNSSSDFVIESSVQDKDLIFKGNDGGSVITAMTIDMSAGGAVNMPTQPAFQCRCTTDNQNNLAIDTHHTVAFSADERFDVAGNFASNTFTAPVTGKYMMAIVVYFLNLDSAANYVEVSLITSNQNYHAILETSSFASDAQYTTVPISVLVDMDFDDTAFVRVYQSAGAAQMDIANSSYFSGYLVA